MFRQLPSSGYLLLNLAGWKGTGWWDLIIGIIVLCTRVFNFCSAGTVFYVAVGMVSWAGVGDHRWKKDALLETSVFLAPVYRVQLYR
jgi:hypothetical protein